MATDRWLVEPMDLTADLDPVCEISRESFARPQTAEMFRREVDQRHNAHVFVIRTSDTPVVGYCAVWMIVDELHIHDLAVRQRWRRLGAGATLLEHTMNAARALGARRATLEIRASNIGARCLYEQSGFRVAGERERYYSDRVDDALVLWRESLGRLETTLTV